MVQKTGYIQGFQNAVDEIGQGGDRVHFVDMGLVF